MATLQLIPTNPLTSTNIRLSSGYSCTIGSSAAADYCFKNADLDEIHCRVTCRGNLSFIECLNFEAKVKVNQEDANRSSLTDGDELQIGLIKFKVALQNDIQQYDPIEAIDSNESLSELDVPGYGLTETASEEPLPQEDELLQAAIDSDDSDQVAVVTDSLDDSADEFGVYIDEYSFEDDVPTAAKTVQVDNASTEEVDFGIEDHSTTSAVELKSGDSGSESFDLTNSSDSTLAEVSFNAPNFKKKALPRSSDPKSSNFLKGLVEESRLVKKTGELALRLASQLLSSPGTKIYRLVDDELVSIDRLESVEIKDSDQGLVLLLSKLERKELSTLLRKKRWQRRIRFPLGLQRFLELSNAVSKDFFKSVDGCLLVPEYGDEFELISTSDKIPDDD